MKRIKNLRSLIMMMNDEKSDKEGEEKQEEETGQITTNQVF